MKNLILILISTLTIMFATSVDAHTSKRSHKHHKVKAKSKVVRTVKQPAVTGSYVLFDYTKEEFDNEHNRNQVRSIASITKMFTAITVVNSHADLYEKLYVTGSNGGKVPRGTWVSRIDLLKAMVMNSDNLAAEVLANNHPGGFSKFLSDVAAHNRNLGLMDTQIVDSSGLLPGNVSTATELVVFLNSIKDNPIIQDISNLRHAELDVPKGKRVLHVTLRNTNPDLYKYDNILISKTGFTSAAGRCVMMLVEKGEKVYALVVLGQPNVQRRSQVVAKLM
jgi:D-alanyl-D-alanine endopeptidase (penicillin-binding protein 7)